MPYPGKGNAVQVSFKSRERDNATVLSKRSDKEFNSLSFSYCLLSGIIKSGAFNLVEKSKKSLLICSTNCSTFLSVGFVEPVIN